MSPASDSLSSPAMEERRPCRVCGAVWETCSTCAAPAVSFQDTHDGSTSYFCEAHEGEAEASRTSTDQDGPFVNPYSANKDCAQCGGA